MRRISSRVGVVVGSNRCVVDHRSLVFHSSSLSQITQRRFEQQQQRQRHPRIHKIMASHDDGGSPSDTSKHTVTFVTGNKKKLEEVVAILASKSTSGSTQQDNFSVVSCSLDLPELQGEPDAIAREKCLLAYKKLRCPVMVEDTSLCFNALHGLPGPYIKDFLAKCGHDGLNRILDGFEDKSAYAQCIFAYHNGSEDENCSGDNIVTFRGITDGKIIPAQGDNNFGWDPIFLPDVRSFSKYNIIIIYIQYSCIVALNTYSIDLKLRYTRESSIPIVSSFSLLSMKGIILSTIENYHPDGCGNDE